MEFLQSIQISFINFSSKKCIASFKNKYINSNQNNFSLIENSINDTSKITSKALIFKQEVNLWKYLYGMSHMKSLQDFLRENDLENEIKILEKPEEITEENFYILEKNFSIRSAFFLIYARGVLQKNITANKAIQAILKKNITRWFSQYYAIDAINLYYYLKIQNLEKAVIEKNSLELILNTIKIFQDRSISMRLFLYFQDFISRINSLLNVKIQFFWSLNLIWNIIRKIKSK